VLLLPPQPLPLWRHPSWSHPTPLPAQRRLLPLLSRPLQEAGRR